MAGKFLEGRSISTDMVAAYTPTKYHLKFGS